MGISGFRHFFGSLLLKRSLSELRGTIVLVDSLFIICKYSIGIRNKGSDMINSNGDIISHLYAIYTVASLLIEKGIHPVFVFDRKTPSIKKDYIGKKKNIKTRSESICDSIEDKTSCEYIKHFKRSFNITHHSIDECKYLLRSMGIPYVDAFEEADSQIAGLCRYYDAQISGAITDDTDILTYGGHTIFTQLSHRDNTVQEITLERVLNKLQEITNEITDKLLIDRKTINYDTFIDFCILMGNDYLEGNKMSVLNKDSLFEKFILDNLNLEQTVINLNKDIPDISPVLDRIKKIKYIYKNTDIYDPQRIDISLNPPKIDDLIYFLENKEICKRDDIVEILKKINNNYNAFLILKKNLGKSNYSSFKGYQHKYATAKTGEHNLIGSSSIKKTSKYPLIQKSCRTETIFPSGESESTGDEWTLVHNNGHKQNIYIKVS